MSPRMKGIKVHSVTTRQRVPRALPIRTPLHQYNSEDRDPNFTEDAMGLQKLGTLFKVMVLEEDPRCLHYTVLLRKPVTLETPHIAFSHEIIWTDFLVI